MYRQHSNGSLRLELVTDYGQDAAGFDKLVEFENKFRDPEEERSVCSSVPKAVCKSASKCSLKKYILDIFPIIKTLRNYSMKEDFVNDVIGGLTAGVMMIPQGMAFGALATLTPIVGLYVCFFSSISYFIFGTSRHISWGPIAILSLMMANILDKYDLTLQGNLQTEHTNFSLHHQNNSINSYASLSINTSMHDENTTFPHQTSTLENQMMNKRIEVASGVSVAAGLILMLTSRLGMSKVTNIMSNSLITGFLIGASIHVSTSQLRGLLGLVIPRLNGIGSVPRTWVEILKNIPNTNPATLIISVVCMLVIYIVKKFVNEKYKQKLRIPIPIEIIVVIITTLISTFVEFQDKFDVIVVEDVPVGLPSPRFPDLAGSVEYIGDGFVIIIVGYAQTVALAKTFGSKYSYQVDPNQEMLACGVGSVICGIFSGYIPAPSVSRTIVQDAAGGRTQVSSLFAALLVLLVIMVIGPYLYFLPTCVLSSIIIISLRSMFLKLLDIPKEWRKSSYDCSILVFTCAATVFISADLGLLMGVIFSVFLVVLRSTISPLVEVGQIPNGNSTFGFRCINHYSPAQKFRNTKIIRIRTALYFINADIFTSQLISTTGIDPIAIKKKKNKSREFPIDDVTVSNNETMLELEVDEVRFVVLDLSEMSFIDVMGVQALQFVVSEFKSVDKEVIISCVPESILPILKSTGFWKKNEDILFMSVEKALAYIGTTELKKERIQIL